VHDRTCCRFWVNSSRVSAACIVISELY
jgi:hypothetical protein